MKRGQIALFGGGPSCLLAAYCLADRFSVTIYEQGKRVGRKFLVAGNGGFNLTNELAGAELSANYTRFPYLKEIIETYDSEYTRTWLEKIGIPTYVGSSGRVFPEKGIKPVHVLNRIMDELKTKGVTVNCEHTFVGFDAKSKPVVESNGIRKTVEADHFIFGLGGGSWSKTGANDRWFESFRRLGVKVNAFSPSNCGLEVNWSDAFSEKFEGTPLKNIAFEYNGKRYVGEAVITTYGLEGNCVYPLSSEVRDHISHGQNIIFLDAKPHSSEESLVQKVNRNTRPKQYAHTLNLTKATLQLAKQSLSKEEYLDPKTFARRLKRIPIPVQGLRPLEEAISTIGGIHPKELSPQLALRKHPHVHILGEMIDWDAPTGGFLLQGCFAMAFWVGQQMLQEKQ